MPDIDGICSNYKMKTLQKIGEEGNPYWDDIVDICEKKEKPSLTNLNDKFSLWHRAKCKDEAWLTDIDAIKTTTKPIGLEKFWAEQRNGEIVVVLEFKYDEGIDKLQRSEKIVKNHFENNGIPFFIIYISNFWMDESVIFRVIRNNHEQKLTEKEFIKWINELKVTEK